MSDSFSYSIIFFSCVGSISSAECLCIRRLIMKDGFFLGTLFLFLTGTGVLGNSFLLILFIVIFFTGQQLSVAQLILAQLALANIMLLFLRGLPLVILNWRNKYFLDDIGCKITFYLQRVGRGMSICSTCLLSGYQAIVISSHCAKWASLKQNAPKYSLISSAFCWAVNAATYTSILKDVWGPKNHMNITGGIDMGYCYWKSNLDYFMIIYTVRDVFFMGLMIFSCVYMLYILRRHHRLVQYIHRTDMSHSKNPEIKAAKRIVLLVFIFFSFYSINGILLVYNLCCLPSSVWLLDTSAVMTLCFPTVSPFLLITSGNRAFRCCTNVY